MKTLKELIEVYSRDTIYDLYINKNMSRMELRSYLGVSDSTVGRLLKFYNIQKSAELFSNLSVESKIKNKKPPHIQKYIDKFSEKEIQRLYITENKTQSEMCTILGCTKKQLTVLLKHLNIKKDRNLKSGNVAASRIANNTDSLKKICDYDKLSYLLNTEHLQLNQIADQLGISEKKVRQLCKLYNLSKLKAFEYYKSLYSYDTLYNLYVSQNQSIFDISLQLKCSKKMVQQLLHYYKVFKLKEDTIKKREQTNINKYGKRYALLTDEYQLKFKEHCAKRYGEEFYNNFKDKESCEKFLLTGNYTDNDLSNTFGIGYQRIRDYINDYNLNHLIKHDVQNPISNFENDVASFITSIYTGQIQRNIRILNGKEIDIYLPDLKIGIECNGTYWHSSLYKEKNYHFEKSKLAIKNNIRLIHIWEYQWNDPPIQEKLKSIIASALGKVKNRVYARKCEVKEISNKDAKEFNNKYHLQKHRNAKITFGLFYNNELLQVMSFSNYRYNKNIKNDFSYEIIRECTKHNYSIVGGCSKLLNAFINKYHPAIIFSYCDFNIFTGKSYEQLGMNFIGYTGPDMKWLIGGIVVNRSPSKHKEYKELAEAQLFGCGSKKYILKI